MRSVPRPALNQTNFQRRPLPWGPRNQPSQQLQSQVRRSTPRTASAAASASASAASVSSEKGDDAEEEDDRSPGW